ncbi:hypothetical protein AALA99_06375 [Anaerotruncus colihominis]|uniref:hypothetical protein n=1 Tax=Anaerotruncus colihominis TaxID=169435 RepID=UPI00351430CF
MSNYKGVLVSDLALLAFPLLAPLSLTAQAVFEAQARRMELNAPLFVCFWAAQFIALAGFLWAFFLRKARRHLLAVVGGLFVLIVCALPPVLKTVSFSLHSAVYGQIQMSILLYGLTFTLYILLLIDDAVKRRT